MDNKGIADSIRKSCTIIESECFASTPPDLDYASQMIDIIRSFTHYISKGIKDLNRTELETLAKLNGFRRERLGTTSDMQLVSFIEDSM